MGSEEGLQEEVMLGCSLEKWEDGNVEGAVQGAGSLSSPRVGGWTSAWSSTGAPQGGSQGRGLHVTTGPWRGKTRTCRAATELARLGHSLGVAGRGADNDPGGQQLGDIPQEL